MTSSDDRWTYPADGQDPREDEAARHVTHQQVVEREQGLSSDRPGIDPSDRDRDGAGLPTAD